MIVEINLREKTNLKKFHQKVDHLDQHCSIQLSVIIQIFYIYILHYGRYQTHEAIEHLNVARVTDEWNF